MTEKSDAAANIRQIAESQPPFGEFLGMRVVTVTPELLEAELTVKPEMGNRNGVLHGGVVSGICDNMGGSATFMNLKPGQATTTIEAKTNFFRPVQIGEKIRAVAIPLHQGRRTAVWQTTIYRADGKVAAISVQTQMIMSQQ